MLEVKTIHRFCPGCRSDYGLIRFTDPGTYREFMAKTKGHVYKVRLNIMDMQFKSLAKPSKEMLASLRTVCELSGIPRDAPDRQVLDVDYRKRHVHFGTLIVD